MPIAMVGGNDDGGVIVDSQALHLLEVVGDDTKRAFALLKEVAFFDAVAVLVEGVGPVGAH